jgi:DNA-directed RNA polymerase specialized sigma24 family protein
MLVPEEHPKNPAGGPSPRPATPETPFPWQEASRLANAHASRIVRRFACQDRHLAEDIAQESLRRLSKNLARIKVSWQVLLHKIVLNSAKSHLMRESRRKKRVACAEMGADYDPPDQNPDPADQVIIDEAMARLPALLGELDEKFGSGTCAIVEFRNGGTRWAEIARIVRMSEKTCRNRNEKARVWLCKRLSLQASRGAQND